MTTPAEKALIYAQGQAARHRPSKNMRRKAELLVAKSMTKKRGLLKALNAALGRR